MTKRKTAGTIRLNKRITDKERMQFERLPFEERIEEMVKQKILDRDYYDTLNKAINRAVKATTLLGYMVLSIGLFKATLLLIYF